MSHRHVAAIVLGVSAAVAAASASAQSINGRYDGYACQNNYRSQLAMDIAWPTLTFFESDCTITGNVAGAANTYTTHCFGEGNEWNGQITLTPLANGNVIVNQNGASTTYNRC
jgi:hypothetical protein